MKERFKELYREHRILFPGFLIFTFLDIVTTVIALQNGITEKNPFPRYLFNEFGLWTIIPMKLFVVVAVMYAEPVSSRFEEVTGLGTNLWIEEYVEENFNTIVLSFGFFVTGAIVAGNLLTLYWMFLL